MRRRRRRVGVSAGERGGGDGRDVVGAAVVVVPLSLASGHPSPAASHAREGESKAGRCGQGWRGRRGGTRGRAGLGTHTAHAL